MLELVSPSLVQVQVQDEVVQMARLLAKGISLVEVKRVIAEVEMRVAMLVVSMELIKEADFESGAVLEEELELKVVVI